MTEVAFEAHQLCKTFRVGGRQEIRALDHIDLTIEKGSFTALTGPSGSGKTTLLSLLGCLDRPTSGSLRFEDREITSCSDAELARMRRRMGFLFQDFALIPRLSLLDNVSYPLIPRGISRSERQRIAVEWLARLEISQSIYQRPEELSGGERQRVALARALAGSPAVVLADEPTSNLDRDTAQGVIQLFAQLHASGTTIVLTTHDPQFTSMATTLVRLNKGRQRAEQPSLPAGTAGEPSDHHD